MAAKPLISVSSSRLLQHLGKQFNFKNKNAFCRLFPKKVELQALMKYYDINGDGSVCYEEFLNGLRDDLTPRRKNMVLKAFAMLDKSGEGVITVQDIC